MNASRMFFLIACVLVTSALMSCYTSYSTLEPEVLNFTGTSDTLDEAICSWKYHLLREMGNDRFARAEKKRKASLIGVRIANTGDRVLHFPEDFAIASEGKAVRMYGLMDGYEALRMTYGEQPSEVEVGGDLGVHLGANEAYKAGMQIQNNMRFYEDLQEHYLAPAAIAPGETKTGILVIRVKPDRPLDFLLLKQ